MTPVRAKKRDIDRGWAWMVLIAVYSSVVVLSTSAFMGGVLYVAVLEEYGGNEALSSLIGSLNSGLLCLLGPVSSVYMNIFSCRVSMVTGGILVSLAYLSSAFVTEMYWLIVTYGLLGGLGNALASTPLIVVLGYYFENRRKTVISVSTAVIGFGMFLSSPMALAVLETYGLSGSFLILSGFNAHLVVFGVICRPSEIEKHIHQKMKYRLHHGQGMKTDRSLVYQCAKQLKSKFNISILRNQVFTVFMFSTLTWNLMLSMFILHLPNYMVNQGATSVNITVIMTCFSVGNMAGRFLGAVVVDRKSINNFHLHIISLGLAGVLTVSFPSFSYVDILKYGFAATSGVLTGIPNALTAPILLEILGVEVLATSHGMGYFFSGVGYVLGPPIAGVLFNQTNTYESSFYFAGTVVIIGAILGCVASCLSERANNERAINGMDQADHFTSEIFIKPEKEEGELTSDEKHLNTA